MTELQQKSFEILKEFLNVCEQLNLRYYAVCGTALGTVKYQGFIPWDDDMDIGLPREDYNIFIEKAPELLPEHLFLQNYVSDPAFPHIYSKLRDSRTTFIEKSVAHLDINHGVYIDIFPLDGYPKTEEEQNLLEGRKTAHNGKLSCVFNLPRSKKAKIGFYLRRILGYHKKTQEILREYTNDISKYPTDTSDVWCNHGNWQGKLEYAARSQYGDGIMMKFEGIDLRVPENFDEYLTQKYGDWRADLPPEEQKGHHYYSVLDLERPYTEYKKRNSAK